MNSWGRVMRSWPLLQGCCHEFSVVCYGASRMLVTEQTTYWQSAKAFLFFSMNSVLSVTSVLHRVIATHIGCLYITFRIFLELSCNNSSYKEQGPCQRIAPLKIFYDNKRIELVLKTSHTSASMNKRKISKETACPTTGFQL